jgi:hypothetical protein
VGQDSLNHRRFFNASNDLDLRGAPLAGLNIDIKYPLQTLHFYALWVQIIEAWRSAGVLSNQFSPAG